MCDGSGHQQQAVPYLWLRIRRIYSSYKMGGAITDSCLPSAAHFLGH